MLLRSRLVLLLGAACVAVVWSWHAGHWRLPDRWNPWAPLAVPDTPNALTRYKLARLAARPEMCRAALETARLRYRPLPDGERGPGCGWRDAVRIESTSMQVGTAFTLSCHAAVSLALWEHHVLQPAARRYFGLSVARLEHSGSYACRNIYGRAEGRRSSHARADALDVTGFVLADGRRIQVLRDWDGREGPASHFLHELHHGACRFFDVVLGPDYNAAHRDHLHLERSGMRFCR